MNTRLVVIMLSVAACATPAPRKRCIERPLGSIASAAQVELVQTARDGQLDLGIRATNLDGCALAIELRIVDAVTGEAMTQSGQFAELAPQQGWGTADLGLVPATSVSGRVADVVVEDANGRWASARTALP